MCTTFLSERSRYSTECFTTYRKARKTARSPNYVVFSFRYGRAEQAKQAKRSEAQRSEAKQAKRSKAKRAQRSVLKFSPSLCSQLSFPRHFLADEVLPTTTNPTDQATLYRPCLHPLPQVLPPPSVSQCSFKAFAFAPEYSP